jgi:hypothetical protein
MVHYTSQHERKAMLEQAAASGSTRAIAKLEAMAKTAHESAPSASQPAPEVVPDRQALSLEAAAAAGSSRAMAKLEAMKTANASAPLEADEAPASTAPSRQSSLEAAAAGGSTRALAKLEAMNSGAAQSGATKSGVTKANWAKVRQAIQPHGSGWSADATGRTMTMPKVETRAARVPSIKCGPVLGLTVTVSLKMK